MTNKAAKGKNAVAINSPKNSNPSVLSMPQPNSNANDSFGQMKAYLDPELGGIKAAILETNKMLQQMSLQLNKNTELLEGVDSRVSLLEKQVKQHSEEFIKNELDKASYIVRIQKVPFSQDEDVYEKASAILAPLLNCSTMDMARELDSVFRAQTLYTRQQRQVAELVVRLTRKSVRDRIFRAQGVNDCNYDGVKLTLLKEIPWSVRQKRKLYKPLVNLLHKNDLSFRWMFPEGVQFMWNLKTTKIDNLAKMHSFITKHAHELGVSESDSGEEEGVIREEEQSDGILTRLQAKEKEREQGKSENWKTERGKV